MLNEIQFTPAKYDNLKKAYDKVVEDGLEKNETFEWDEPGTNRTHTLVVGYVKYMLQYLGGLFGETRS